MVVILLFLLFVRVNWSVSLIDGFRGINLGIASVTYLCVDHAFRVLCLSVCFDRLEVSVFALLFLFSIAFSFYESITSSKTSDS